MITYEHYKCLISGLPLESMKSWHFNQHVYVTNAILTSRYNGFLTLEKSSLNFLLIIKLICLCLLEAWISA